MNLKIWSKRNTTEQNKTVKIVSVIRMRGKGSIKTARAVHLISQNLRMTITNFSPLEILSRRTRSRRTRP